MEEQLAIIAGVRAQCATDDRVTAAWMYGSFAIGEADQYSDVEFLIYVRDEALPNFDPPAWLAQVSPVALYLRNEYGVGTALFANTVRGEFHFEPHSTMDSLVAFGQQAGFPPIEQMLIVDKTGALEPLLAQISGPGPERATRSESQRLVECSQNWLLMGLNVLARGERVRALELLGTVHRYLLQMARQAECSLRHYATPARRAEQELSADALARFAGCTASLRGDELERAYASVWRWMSEMDVTLAERYGLFLPKALLVSIERRFASILSRGSVC